MGVDEIQCGHFRENRNKYWKSIKERLSEPGVFEKEVHLENAARLISASGAVVVGFTQIS